MARVQPEASPERRACRSASHTARSRRLKQIAARVGWFALQLLRRHVLQGAENLSLGGQRLRHGGVGFGEWRGFEFRQPEIQQLDALLGDEDVGGLQIAMRDALAVRGVERITESARRTRSACSSGSGPLSGEPSTNSITR